MSTQIAVRLPDDLVAYLDDAAQQAGRSRASIVTQALELYRMRLQAERDALILAETGDYDDLAGLAAVPQPDLD